MKMSRETIKKNRKVRARRWMQARKDGNQLGIEQQRIDRNQRDEIDWEGCIPNVYHIPKEWLKEESE